MFALSVLCCLVAGVIGALFGLKSSSGGSLVWPLLAGQLSTFTWMWMTKQPIKPWVASVVFDGVYCSAWLLTLLAVGQKPTITQMLGGVFVFIGIVLAAL